MKTMMLTGVGKGCFQYLLCFRSGIHHSAGPETKEDRAKIQTSGQPRDYDGEERDVNEVATEPRLTFHIFSVVSSDQSV